LLKDRLDLRGISVKVARVKVGAWYVGSDRCQFTVWAPSAERVAVKIVAPTKWVLPMQPLEFGYWQVTAEPIVPGTTYMYQLDGEFERPDPASQSQPEGVHGVSQIIDHPQFAWSDRQWSNLLLAELIIYELHTGTFTPEGTFDAIVSRLPYLKDLGVNTIELMPISQFPGNRNWGYDGAYPYAVQDSYGGVDGLKRLVDACHQQGIAILLDVVYNHFGPEGCYIGDFGPYYIDKYQCLWGSALNFDGAQSYGVRNYFIENALYWLETFHIDGLRLDASDNIFDLNAKHFLQELAQATAELSTRSGRTFYLIAENDLSDVRLTRTPAQGGYGLDAQWNDAFHHCVHTVLTGEQSGYYKDYGTFEQLAKAYKQGFVYSWDYSPDRQRYHGSDSSELPGQNMVVCIQNHDQVGNRILGDRLTRVVSFDALKVAAAALFLAPNIPLLFMGEEYAEDAPFLYFVSHTDPELIAAVRAGRKQEFAHFHQEQDYIDPESNEAFNRSRLRWETCQQGKHQVMFGLYQHLIQLRRTIPSLKQLNKQNLNAIGLEEEKVLLLHRWCDDGAIFCLLNFGQEDVSFSPNIPDGNWQKILDSADEKWLGAGSLMPEILSTSDRAISLRASSFALYQSHY
jgi:maltooligosyltrehalose trehalohydrolase